MGIISKGHDQFQGVLKDGGGQAKKRGEQGLREKMLKKRRLNIDNTDNKNSNSRYLFNSSWVLVIS